MTCVLVTLSLAVVTLVIGLALRADAFSVLIESGAGVEAVMANAPRWSAEPDPFGLGTGLHDGLQVGVVAGFGEAIGLPAIAALYGVSVEYVEGLMANAILQGIRSWENGALQFEITLDVPAPSGGESDFEILLFAQPFPDTFFGSAYVDSDIAAGRLLTNGQRLDGQVIYAAEVYMNSTRIAEGIGVLHAVGLSIELAANALQILVAHEFGHAIGLGHPNGNTFYDTDADPYNAMAIDPQDPFADLVVSSIPAAPPPALLPIMWGGISSGTTEDMLALFVRLEDPALANDDLGGRDVLYPHPLAEPVPLLSPPGLALLGSSLWLVAIRGLRKQRDERSPTSSPIPAHAYSRSHSR